MPKAAKNPRSRAGKQAAGPLESPPENLGDQGGEAEEGERLFPEATPANRIRVQRMDDYSKKMVLHGYMDHVEQTEARIAELWGGGKYVVSMLGTNEQGYSVVKRKKDLPILGPYKTPNAIYGVPGNAAPMPAPVGADVRPLPARIEGPAVTPREALEAAQVAQLLEITNAGRSIKGGLDWEKILPFLAPALTKMIEVLFAPKGDSDLAAAVRSLEAKLGNQPGPAQSQLGDILKAIDQVMGVRQDLRDARGDGGEDKDTDPMKLVSQIVEMISSAQRGTPAPAAAPVSRIPGKTEVPPNPVPDMTPKRPMWQDMLHHYGPQLVGAAQRGADPGALADLASTFVPSEYQGVVVEFLQRPDAATVAVQEIPALGEFANWNDTFWTEFRRAILGEEEDTE